jgi:hypothetical protein
MPESGPGSERKSARQTLAQLAAEVGLLAGAPSLLLLVSYFSWGAGVYRFFTLAVLLAFVAVATSGRLALRSVFSNGRARFLLVASALLLVAVEAKVFIDDTAHGVGCMTDMGRPSICAGEFLLAGLNPWSQCAPRPRPHKKQAAVDTWSWCLETDTCIDRKVGGTYGAWTHHKPGIDFMDGYKYGPLMALVYLPSTHRLREPGLYVVNFAFWVAQLVLLGLLARAAYPRVPGASWRSVIGLLLPAAIPLPALLPSVELETLGRHYRIDPPESMVFIRELTSSCSNDIIPLALALLALLLAARRRSFAAGVLIGLSLATKQLPAPLIGLLLVRLEGVDWKRLVAGAVATAAAIYLPFFLWAPREMFANLILFGLLRPTNASSIRRYLPASLQALVSLAQLGAVLFFVVFWFRRPRHDLAGLLRIAALLIIAFVALNKVVHGNYLLWIQPFAALALAGGAFAQVEAAEGSRRSPPNPPEP